jgi:hypothetical protein
MVPVGRSGGFDYKRSDQLRRAKLGLKLHLDIHNFDEGVARRFYLQNRLAHEVGCLLGFRRRAGGTYD